MKRKVFFVLVTSIFMLLCACGNSSKENIYQQFTDMVESGEYKGAKDFLLEEYKKASSTSYEDFKAECFAYKDFENYYNYASALEDYVGVECKSLSRLRYLEKVPVDFLDTEKYKSEMSRTLESFQGVYECLVDDTSVFHYIIVKDEHIWFANGLSTSELSRSDIVDHVVAFENNLSIDEFCERESSWDIYFNDGKYMAGNSLVKSESDCIFAFILDGGNNFGIGTQMVATATGSYYDMFNGTYEKIQ